MLILGQISQNKAQSIKYFQVFVLDQMKQGLDVVDNQLHKVDFH